ncbi:hypothetical protein PG996_012092 [Apiospora saccharicola]|uniref:Uncharacterized protein n=1 Tax=Apiospora saccharicola TaxID=335842 RepID=A0ABR1U3Q2_9PEZI
MRRSSRQLQFRLADRQSLESGHYSRTEPPSVEPLTPIQTDYEAAALAASRLDSAVLITKLINLSKDTDILKQTLLSFPNGQISVPVEYQAPIEDLHNDRSSIDAPESFEDGQEAEQVQLDGFSSEPNDEPGDKHLSIEPEDRVEDYQSPEEIQSEKDISDDEIEDSQSPGEIEEDDATEAEHETENSLPLEEDEFHSGHAPDDILSLGVEAHCEPESEPYDSLLDLVDVDAQEPFCTLPSPLDDDIPVIAGSPESTAPPGTPRESPSKYTATTLVGSSPQNPPTESRETTPAQSTVGVEGYPYWRLVTQSETDFATESFKQVKGFSVPGNSQDNI